MKIQLISTFLILVISTVFAGTNPIKKVVVDTKNSTISWVGKKVIGKHTGTLTLQEGYLEINRNTITGGVFIIDMTSLQVTDLAAGKGKEKLESHLSSSSFFDIATHPTATFKITEATSNDGSLYNVVGELTIKGHTETTHILLIKSRNNFTTTFEVDRTKYDIIYDTGGFLDGLKNKAIHNKFELTMSLHI